MSQEISHKVILKKGKEKPIKNRHHWIFSGAVKHIPKFENGSILPVYSHNNEFLGLGYFNRKTSIFGRMLTYDNTPLEAAIRDRISSAFKLRQTVIDRETNTYRLINGEGDGLPGLICDKYKNIIVLQISTLGMEKLKNLIIGILKDIVNPTCIYEKSKSPSRREEGMTDSEGVLYGELESAIEIKENGLRFIVNVHDAQKTGFYLDQRNMRQLIKSFSRGKKIMNCFSYTGGFSVYALKGGAMQIDTIDSSEEAIELAKENVRLNGFGLAVNKFYIADVFEFLRASRDMYDIVVLDPPAFARRKKDLEKALKGYKDINRVAIKRIKNGGMLFTFSCSYHVSSTLFQQVIFQAAKEANRNLRIIQKHRMAYDHPINIYHPEGEYLKGLVLYVD